MSPTLSKGKAVQILTFEKGKVKLFSDRLRQILTEASVKDLPVVPISIAGKKRHGKSLLLSHFVRYSQLQGREDWLSDSHGPLNGFKWEGGSTGVTTGIYIWSQLFIVQLPTRKKVALLLMDTQGSFDTRSDMNESSIIFALSAMISSVQIYNIKGFLAGDDLMHLQTFIEYGKLAQQYDPEGASPFQILQILVRDWPYPKEAGYGADGGCLHLEKVMELEATQNQSSRTLVKDIKSSFAEVRCFMMPEPEKCVREGTFDGTPSVMGDQFIACIIALVESILHPSQLVVKQQAGREIKTAQLMYQFESLVKIFNDKMPDPQSMLEGIASSSYLIAIDEAMLVFANMAKEQLGPGKPALSVEHMISVCENFKRAAIEDLLKTPKMGGKALAEKFRKILEVKLEKSVQRLQNDNLIRLEEELQRKEEMENHERKLREMEERHRIETLEALERAREEDREMLRLNEEKHLENIERMQKEFQERSSALTAEERKQAQAALDRAQHAFKEQAERERAESERRIKECQERGDEVLAKLMSSREEDMEKMQENERRHQQNIERMQRDFQERCDAMSAEERQRAQDAVESAQRAFQEQAQRDKKEADERLEENQRRAEENMKKMMEDSNEKFEKLMKQNNPPKDDCIIL